MPTVAIVRGVLIMFYYNDHDPPHFHAQGPGFSARLAIADGSPRDIVGSVPASVLRDLSAWAAVHRDGLMENWALARAGRPLKRIPS
ncbi:MAG: DUF4160 domain-containing protein [Alphaproteobacteria bacterium]|nr:DUF4160 domain-containing protein [Alphaproteobacteria bacterium]